MGCGNSSVFRKASLNILHDVGVKWGLLTVVDVFFVIDVHLH